MSARVLYIKKKLNLPPESWVNLGNFRYRQGEDIDAATIMRHPNQSLYCLDESHQRAIFVEVPVGIDLSEAPFYYQAQFKHARRLIAVPYEELHQLANNLGDPFEKLILIYSVGRCGSTLLSRIFNQLNEVISLSEPDIFTQIVGLRSPDGSRDPDLAELLHSCIRLLGKPAPGGGKKIPCLAIKFRSFGIELADLMYQAFPQAKIIFLYRNAEDVIESFINAFGNLGFWGRRFRSSQISRLAKLWLRVFIARRKKSMARLIPLIGEYSSKTYADLGAAGFVLIMWLSVMQRYLHLYRLGIPMLALRYEDLLANPQRMVASIFEYSGLPLSEVQRACLAFEEDAQAGSRLARKQPDFQRYLSLDDLLKICQLLRRHPDIHSPDFIVPGTMGTGDVW